MLKNAVLSLLFLSAGLWASNEVGLHIDDVKEGSAYEFPPDWQAVVSLPFDGDVNELLMAITRLRQSFCEESGLEKKPCCLRRNRHEPLLDATGDGIWHEAILAELPKTVCHNRFSKYFVNPQMTRLQVNMAALLYLVKTTKYGEFDEFFDATKSVIRNLKIHFPLDSKYAVKYLDPILEAIGRKDFGSAETLTLKAIANRLPYFIKEIDQRGMFSPTKVELYSPSFTPKAVLDLVQSQEPRAVESERAYKKRMTKIFYMRVMFAVMMSINATSHSYLPSSPILDPFVTFVDVLIWLGPQMLMTALMDMATTNYCNAV